MTASAIVVCSCQIKEASFTLEIKINLQEPIILKKNQHVVFVFYEFSNFPIFQFFRSLLER